MPASVAATALHFYIIVQGEHDGLLTNRILLGLAVFSVGEFLALR
jgi:hypothetical protein